MLETLHQLLKESCGSRVHVLGFRAFFVFCTDFNLAVSRLVQGADTSTMNRTQVLYARNIVDTENVLIDLRICAMGELIKALFFLRGTGAQCKCPQLNSVSKITTENIIRWLLIQSEPEFCTKQKVNHFQYLLDVFQEQPSVCMYCSWARLE